MKLAICGSGPFAIETALHFNNLGASVTMFSKSSKLGGSAASFAEQFPEQLREGTWAELTSEVGRNLIGKSFELKDSPTTLAYWNEYLKPISESKEILSLVKVGEVQRVQKRFLTKEFVLSSGSRLKDLFRVIYSQNPKESILKQVEENPEVFEKLGKDVVESLGKAVESFEDFDLVIDATGSIKSPRLMGAGNAPALNELNLNMNTNIFYGSEIFSNLEKVKEESNTILLVGTGWTSANVLLGLKTWLTEKSERKLFVITDEEKPYLKLRGQSHFSDLLNLLGAEVEGQHVKYDDACNNFEKALFEWRELESHIRMKTPQPSVPEAQLQIFTHSFITSLDRLVDREGLFVTFESPSYLTEDGEETLKTFGVDSILVATGHEDVSIAEGLIEDEPGFYSIKSQEDRYTIKSILNEIPKIEKNVLSFFSRA